MKHLLLLLRKNCKKLLERVTLEKCIFKYCATAIGIPDKIKQTVLPEPFSLLLDLKCWNVYLTDVVCTLSTSCPTFTWVLLLWSPGTLLLGPHFASVIKVCPTVAVCIAYIQAIMRMQS